MANGPTDRGFDYFYGLTSPSGPPYLYMVNDMAEKQPNTRFEESGGGLYKIKGGIGHSDWSADGMQPHLADKMLGYRIADDEAEDSFSFWPILDGSGNAARTDLIATSGAGYFTHRTPQYKLIFNAGNGSGEEYRIDGQPPAAILRHGQRSRREGQPDKQSGIRRPDQEMTARVKKYIEDGRSTPEAQAANDSGNSWKQITDIMSGLYAGNRQGKLRRRMPEPPSGSSQKTSAFRNRNAEVFNWRQRAGVGHDRRYR